MPRTKEERIKNRKQIEERWKKNKELNGSLEQRVTTLEKELKALKKVLRLDNE